MRVLLAEDDTDVLDVTAYALRKFGFNVTSVTDGGAAIQRWSLEQPDVVLLDVNLPGVSGFEVCKQIRAKASTPIVMFTAMSDETHVVEGFECGADDYVCKPASYKELAMRMRAVIRRHTGGPVLEARQLIETGDLLVNLEAHEVRKAGVAVRLTRLEARVLFFLASNAGRVLPTARLIELVWNYDGGDAFSLKTHISHLRQKLGLTRERPGYISSIPNVGYILEAA